MWLWVRMHDGGSPAGRGVGSILHGPSSMPVARHDAGATMNDPDNPHNVTFKALDAVVPATCITQPDCTAIRTRIVSIYVT